MARQFAANLLRCRPECALALDVLKANGGMMPVCEWFALHPDLQAYDRFEKTSIVRQLEGAGCIERVGRKSIPSAVRGKRSGTSQRIVWRVV